MAPSTSDPRTLRRFSRPLMILCSLLLLPPVVASADPSGPAAGPTDIQLAPTSRAETPEGYGQLAPFPSAGPEGFVRVQRYGSVYAMTDAQRSLWYRSSTSLLEDWGVEGWLSLPTVYVNFTRPDPESLPPAPIPLESDNPFAVGDLNGDGWDDVALAPYVELPLASKGSYLTVLDGRTGATLWWKRFPGVVNHLVTAEIDPSAGRELIVARVAIGTGTSLVSALDFGGAPLADRMLWSFDTGATAARILHLDLVSAEPPRVALSWSVQAYNTGGLGPRGDLAVLDATTGTQLWRKQTVGWVRMFHGVPDTDTFATLELANPFDPTAGGFVNYAYTIRSLSVSDGAERRSIVRNDAVPVRFEVGDADGDGEAEWVVSDVTLNKAALAAGGNAWVSTRVSVIEPRPPDATDLSGGVRWTYESPSDRREKPFGLAVVPSPRPMVVVAATSNPSMLPSNSATNDYGLLLQGDTLFALAGDSVGAASVLWRDDGVGIFPMFVAAGKAAGKPAILVGTTGTYLGGNGTRAYNLLTGERVASVAMLAEPYAVASADVDGEDALDLVVGGESEVVMALDGDRLDEVPPGVLWSTGVGGPIREIRLADVAGDARPELVVAASSEVSVLSLADGEVLWSYLRPPERLTELFWTMGLGDLDGDGRTDIVVPGQRLIALEGATGQVLWTREPPRAGDPTNFSSVAIADGNGDGTADVAAEYTVDPPNTLAPFRALRLGVFDGATGEPLWERVETGAYTQPWLWRSVVSYQTGSGPRFAFLYLEGMPAPVVPALSERWTRVAVYDGQGGLVWTNRTTGLFTPTTLLMHSPRQGDEILSFDTGFVRYTPIQVAETTSGMFMDAAFAQLVPGERYLVAGKHGASIAVYPEDVAWGLGGADPAPLTEWGGPWRLSRLHVADLDDDGLDEIVATSFDYPVFDRVLHFAGSAFAGGGCACPRGLVVLNASSVG